MLPRSCRRHTARAKRGHLEEGLPTTGFAPRPRTEEKYHFKEEKYHFKNTKSGEQKEGESHDGEQSNAGGTGVTKPGEMASAKSLQRLGPPPALPVPTLSTGKVELSPLLFTEPPAPRAIPSRAALDRG